MELTQFVDPVVDICRRAGEKILDVYGTDFDVQRKDDRSPLTEADLAAHRSITAGLRELTPEMPMISEEAGLPAFDERAGWDHLWLIDPLDGTREFVNRNGEFTVNVALIRHGRPVFGVVHVPVSGKTYIGCEGYGAERREGEGTGARIAVSTACASPVRVVGSRSHSGDSLDAFLERLGDYELHAVGSSLKFCFVAEGSADIYPRLGPTSEWDTAAAQAVVEQAGGRVLELDGMPLSYNRKENILNPYFLVIGPSDRDWLGMAQDAG